MKYWYNEIQATDKIVLAPASSNVVVGFLVEPHPTNPEFRRSYVNLGPQQADGYETIEEACWYFLGEYHGHLEISMEEYEQLDRTTSPWVWTLDATLPALMPIMRAQRLKNVDVPDHVNEFFSFLGFNEFHAPKHRFLSDNGFMPPMIEGRPEMFPSSGGR